MSNNTRQEPGRRDMSRSRPAGRGRTDYQWTADSDWLRAPADTSRHAALPASRLPRSRAVPVPESPEPTIPAPEHVDHVAVPAPSADGPRWFDELLPAGYDLDPHDFDTAVVPAVEQLFSPDPDALAAYDHSVDDGAFYDDEIAHRFAETRFDRVRSRLTPRVLAIAAAVVVVLGGGAYFLQSDDGDSADLTAVAGPTSTTIEAPATEPVKEPGVDTVRTGPGLPVASDEEPADGAEAVPGESEGANGADESADGTVDGDGATTPDASGSAGTPTAGNGAPSGAGAPGPAVSGDYASNLAMIQAQTVRNRNEDNSPHRQTPSNQLVPENHYGPRSDYLQVADGNIEPSFPVQYGGQFRVACEFSHFAYDDPLVYPNQPGASHLHMFFGNTDTNAFSTADTIKNSGGGTCNGSELNRTGYWVPAMFDGQGNVRIPERVVIYYKGEGLANGKAEVFPDGAAMIASVDLNTIAPAQGGAAGKFSFNCSNNYSGFDSNLSNTVPACVGNSTPAGDMYSVLEVNVKFPQCWNGQDAGNPANFRHPSRAGWYGSLCDGAYNRTLVNLEYFVNYRVEAGESTDSWFFSSDVSPTERVLAQTPGSTNHGDWWSGWHNETNKMFIDNCVNFSTSAPSGCGFGYLTDGGPDNNNPKPGPALKLRDQYLGPLKVKATDLHAELCPNGGTLSSPAAAAFCTPAAAVSNTSAPGGAPAAHSPNALFCPVHRGMLASDPASPLSGSAQ